MRRIQALIKSQNTFSSNIDVSFSFHFIYFYFIFHVSCLTFSRQDAYQQSVVPSIDRFFFFLSHTKWIPVLIIKMWNAVACDKESFAHFIHKQICVFISYKARAMPWETNLYIINNRQCILNRHCFFISWKTVLKCCCCFFVSSLSSSYFGQPKYLLYVYWTNDRMNECVENEMRKII